MQGMYAEDKWGIAMTAETMDFDCGTFPSLLRLDREPKVSTFRSYAAATELCRSVSHANVALWLELTSL